MNLLSEIAYDSIIECGRDEYPFTMMEVPLDKNYSFMKIDVSFDIFMNMDAEKPFSSVKVQICRRKNDGQIVEMSSEFIDLYRVGGFNKWQNWSIDEILKQKIYHYGEGNALIVRFWNYDKIPFKIRAAKATLSVEK
jgi:hypothetical protein